MATAAGRVDEFVKDYLAFRGLSSSLRALESELKNEKEKAFRADKMIEQLQFYITTYDISNLRDYWNFLNSRLFSRLEQRHSGSIRKLEVGLLKYYLVHAAMNNKQDKIMDFFERMTELLHNQSEFRDWFGFPFIRNPEENSHFAMYFTRQWQDTFFLSLYNFLSVVLQAMLPVLLNFEADYRKLKTVQQENNSLKQQIISLGHKPDLDSETSKDKNMAPGFHRGGMDLVYDFSSLGEDTAIPETQNKSPRKFTFPSSPLNKVLKQTTVAKKKESAKDDVLKMTTKSTVTPSRGSRLLPVITRQKKTKSVTIAGVSQSHSSDNPAANQNPASESSSNNRPAESHSASQKHKKTEETKPQDGGPGEKPHNEGRSEMYTRSVSAPSSEASRQTHHKHVETRSKTLSKIDMSAHPVTKVSVSSDPGTISTSSGTVGPLATAAMATMMQPAMSGEAAELQALPQATGSDTQASGPDPRTTEPTGDISKPVEEKPFLLLSQDEYSEHGSSISYCRFSTSGHYVASVDVDGVVKVWQWSPQPSTSATVMSKSAFLSLEWASKSDRWLLLGNRSGQIRLFDVREMKSFYEATGDSSYPRVICLCANPANPTFVSAATVGRNRAGSIGGDSGPSVGNKVGKLTIWDLKTMKPEKNLPLEPGPVGINCCAYNHNGQLLVTGGVDGQIRLFDVHQQKCISQWGAHQGEIRGVYFSHDENTCYSFGMDNQLIQWSVNRPGHRQSDLPIHQGAAPQFLTSDPIGNKEVPRGQLLAMDCDGNYMLSCDENKALIYKMSKHKPYLSKLMDLKGQKASPVTTVDWSPNIDTKVCLTGSMDGKIKVSTLLSQQ